MGSDYLADMMQKAKKVEVKETTPEQKEENIVKEVKQEDLNRLKQLTENKVPDLAIEPMAKEKTEVEKDLSSQKKIELKSYGKTRIFKIPGIYR